MSHETIRQSIIEAEVEGHRAMEKKGRVFFIEADGLYVKRQRSRIKGKEEKIITIHQGWEKNGKRVSLVNRRYMVHQTNEPIWEAVENFLRRNTAMIRLRIGGHQWRWSPMDYSVSRIFRGQGYFSLIGSMWQERFVNCSEVMARYRVIRKKLASWDEEGVLRELTSAIGTLEHEEKEKQLEALVRRIEEMPGCLRDYRVWLKEKGLTRQT
nr:UPF0236 family protein [Anoxybacillus flavithermus]